MIQRLLYRLHCQRQCLTKPLLMMKMVFLMLTLFSASAYADGFAQKRITLKLDGAELKTALQQIEKKTDYRFLYKQQLLNNAGRVSISANNELVANVLNVLFAGKGIAYQMLENELIVLKAEGDDAAAAPKTISGVITDGDGKPVPGASIVIKGTKTGTAADTEGKFTITAEEDATLVITAVGYGTQEMRLAGRDNFDVVLTATSTASLNEVVVIGYGTATKRDLTGSIAKVSGKDIAYRPNPNPVSSLQGMVAGVSIVNSGTPGAEPDIRIRGTNSINGAKPLYVIDGILNDNLDFVNPNDIESIEILKDPSSLAIFGVKGANGVIAVTTKKGRAGRLSINLTTNTGFKTLVDKIDVADAALFKELYQEEEINIGVPENQRFDFTPWTGNTDWVDELTRTGVFTNTNLSVSQGSDRNKFYAGIGYTLDQGVIKNQQLQRYFINLSDEVKIGNYIKLGFNVNAMRQRLPYSSANGLLFNARRVLPITPAMDPTGTYFTELALQSAQIGNPLLSLVEKWDKERINEMRYVGNIYVDINFLKNFNWRSTFYADQSIQELQRYNPILQTYNPSVGGPDGSVYVDRNNRNTSVDQNTQRWNKYQQDHILTYKSSFSSDHNLNVTAGLTTFANSYDGLFATVRQPANGDPIPDDPRFWYIDNGFGDPASRRASSGQSESSIVGLLFRALYNFQNKYYINGSFRRDGSSQISPDERWQNYYSVGGAWEISRESFMEGVAPINFLKLKASYGVLGSQNVPGDNPYPFYPGLLAGNTAVFGSIIAPAYSQAYVPDRNLRWEKVTGWEAGFEANLLNNRLNVNAVYYYKKTSDILAFQRVAGTPQPTLTNVAEMENKGIEMSAGWTQKLGSKVTWTINGNLTTFDNEVLAADEIPASEERPNRTLAGYPIGYFYGYVVDGLYQSYADKLASPTVVGYEYGPGDFKYRDLNGDGRIDTDDRTIIGNPTPDFSYGLSTTVSISRLDIGMDVQGVYGNEVYRYWGSSELPFTIFNYPAFKANRWNGPGTSNWDPILGQNRAINRLPSTYGIEDGSYFRIRNVNVGYNFGSLWNNKISGLRLYANVQNLKTWKRNSGYTPEFGGSTTSFGIDNGDGPMPRVVTFGLNLTF